jgi:hypothetical protein
VVRAVTLQMLPLLVRGRRVGVGRAVQRSCCMCVCAWWVGRGEEAFLEGGWSGCTVSSRESGGRSMAAGRRVPCAKAWGAAGMQGCALLACGTSGLPYSPIQLAPARSLLYLSEGRGGGRG